METILEEKYKDHVIKIYFDDDSINPIKEWDMLGEFVCFHRRYDLSNTDRFSSPEEVIDYIKTEDVIALPLYLYDHSGITMSTTPFSCPWDSGQVGFILVDRSKVMEEFNRKKWSKQLRAKVEEILKAEVKTFDKFLTGQVYGYVIEDKDEVEHIDSCWGFYDELEEVVKMAKEIIDFDSTKETKNGLL